MPSFLEWRKFTEWAAQFGAYRCFSLLNVFLTQDVGEITYLEALGQPIVVLNSYRVCLDLYVKRSAIYSDRPRVV